MATQEVKVHTVRINGGMIREMESPRAKLFFEKGEREQYYSWDYGMKEHKTQEDWEAYRATKTFEELQEEYPKFKTLQLDLQDEELL